MTYASVCSGAEAFGPAWHELGYEPVFHAEIEPHASAVLRYHYPTVPNYGDFTKIATPGHAQPNRPVRLLCGGTPCQSFSVAGLREGLVSDKGNLALEFLLLAKRLGAIWILWENVPGVLSSVSHESPDSRPPQIDLDGANGPADGTEVVVEDEYDADENHAFNSFLAGLSELGYGVAYRVLDAADFGLYQRRKRVYAVACLGDWRAAAAVLFDAESLCGHPQKSASAKQGPKRLFPTLTRSGAGSLREEQGYVVEPDSRIRHLTPVENERLQGWRDNHTKHGADVDGIQYDLSNQARNEIIGNGWPEPVVTWIASRIKQIDNLINPNLNASL